MRLLIVSRHGIRYTLDSAGCGVWRECGREVRAAVVHCHERDRNDPKASWSVTVRLEDGERVDTGDDRTRRLPGEIEERVADILRGAKVEAA